MRLLHEGTGKSATISAFVEIVFDSVFSPWFHLDSS
jgi:hypothetical protein